MRTKAAALAAAMVWMFIPARGTARPASFLAGVAVRSIDPCAKCPQFLGGFGYGKPTSRVHDELEVRAMAIARGTRLVVFASVDTQGYFAGNQEGPWGNQNARAQAASLISRSTGYKITQANIIVSSTHTHAAPTIMGIWGNTDISYLKHVYNATVGSLVGAVRALRPAVLYAGEADISTLNVTGVSQTDGYQGWAPDGKLPVLWARAPDTGATIGVYADVPSHADIVKGADLHLISADHVGVERSILDRDLHGTAVIAMGTLGRQESIVQTQGLAQATNAGVYVANEIERALARAKPVTDGTLAAAERYILVPATNPLLLALNAANLARPTCVQGADICTIDRASLPPYAVGNNIGTWVTAFRIGHLIYATEPGEAFPEVSTAIRKVFPGADVRVVGMAQDQLGYYYPPETYPWVYVNNSDHHLFNASLFLGEANVAAHALNAVALGFEAAVVHETSQFTEPRRAVHAGVQFFPVVREQAGRRFLFDARWSSPAMTSMADGTGATHAPRRITWDFGDGSHAATGEGIIEHAYHAAGIYRVTAAVRDPSDGATVTWSQTVIIDQSAVARVSRQGARLTVHVSGGQGTPIAAHWSFSDGRALDGLSIPAPPGAHGTVVVVDGAGTHSTARF